jgi:serine O-acetyltransferase
MIKPLTIFFRNIILDYYYYYLITKNKSSNKFTLFFLSPRLLVNILLRITILLHSYRITRPFSFFLSWVNFFIFNIEFSGKCQIGPGLFIPHSSGIVLGARQIGKNVVIFQGVTIGSRGVDFEFKNRPSIGNNVIIGAGAKILGNIKMYDGSKAAANSLVLNSVPKNCLAIGVPAKNIIKIKS